MSGIFFVRPDKDFLRPDEVARFLNVHIRTVGNLMNRGVLGFEVFPSGVRRIPVASLVNFLREGLMGEANCPLRVRFDEPLLRPEQLARVAGVSRYTACRWSDEGKLVTFDVCQGCKATLRIPRGALAPQSAEEMNAGKEPSDLEEEL